MTVLHKETDLLKPSNPYSPAQNDTVDNGGAELHDVPHTFKKKIRPQSNYGIGQYVEKLIPKSCKLLGLGAEDTIT